MQAFSYIVLFPIFIYIDCIKIRNPCGVLPAQFFSEKANLLIFQNQPIIITTGTFESEKGHEK